MDVKRTLQKNVKVTKLNTRQRFETELIPKLQPNRMRKLQALNS